MGWRLDEGLSHVSGGGDEHVVVRVRAWDFGEKMLMSI